MQKVLIAALALAVSGCASGVKDVKQSTPIASFTSSKSPDEFAACVANKWQERDPRLTSMKVPDGVRITIKAFGMSDAVVALLDALSTEKGGTSAEVRSKMWSDRVASSYLADAQSCI